MPIILAFWRQRQENHNFKASLGFTEKLSQNTKTHQNPLFSWDGFALAAARDASRKSGCGRVLSDTLLTPNQTSYALKVKTSTTGLSSVFRDGEAEVQPAGTAVERQGFRSSQS